jgi:cysteinyl-tRNA synthetase
MELKLYDTLTREKRPFQPIDPARVRMYVCGPTVYDFAHIGNARPVIVFDVLFRLLRHIYGDDHVTYVRNVTDVDDKINARAAERGISIQELTKTTYVNFSADVKALGCLEPTAEPRATEHIAAMKELIERLVQAGCAYVAEDHVLFNVAAMPDYGKLSRRSLDEMIAGARVEVAPYKRAPTDFVLWKPSKPGEPAWPSPAGVKTPGRPGWHIECSAMADYWLWTKAKQDLSPVGLAHPHQFDIHGGGIDLVFPHHENEIAQSCCAFHTPVMANYWMHNGFLQVEGEKMAKSAGNFLTIRELLEDWPGGAIRLTMLQTHYRQPINWTANALRTARDELASWALTVFDSELLARFESDRMLNRLPPLDTDFVDALSDDLNTARAIAALRAIYRKSQRDDKHNYHLLNAAVFLGLFTLRNVGALIPSTPGSASIEQLGRHREMFQRVQAASANSRPEIIEQANNTIAHEGIAFIVSPSDGFVQLNRVSSVAASGEMDRVVKLIEARNAARAAKNFAESDRIRDELAAMGVVLKDSKEGTTWEIAR